MSSKRYKEGDTFSVTLRIRDVDEGVFEDDVFEVSQNAQGFALEIVELGMEVDEWVSHRDLDEAFNPTAILIRLKKEVAELAEQQAEKDKQIEAAEKRISNTVINNITTEEEEK